MNKVFLNGDKIVVAFACEISETNWINKILFYNSTELNLTEKVGKY